MFAYLTDSRWINRYAEVQGHPELSIERYYLDPTARVNLEGILHGNELSQSTSIQDGIDYLKSVYTANTGYEFAYIEVFFNLLKSRLL